MLLIRMQPIVIIPFKNQHVYHNPFILQKRRPQKVFVKKYGTIRENAEVIMFLSTENFPGKHQVLGIVSGTAKVMLPSDSIDQFEAFDQLFADVQEILKQRAAGHGADGVVGIRFEQTVANVQVAPKFLVLTGYGTMIKLVK